MAAMPASPKIYHITHWLNLAHIIECGGLWSDARRIQLGLDTKIVGISGIKDRRLRELDVKCYQGTKVGEYVPFYYCPRSVMLYILHMGNHPALNYHGGQEPIVHLVADLNEVARWASGEGVRWAIADRNAGARYASFFGRLSDLPRLDWAAIANSDFRDPAVKESKQAEFLLYEFFPWGLVERIGVASRNVESNVNQMLASVNHKPPVSIERSWYF